jgi:hypothetical protein
MGLSLMAIQWAPGSKATAIKNIRKEGTMKKILIISILAALLALPLIMAGCGGASLTEGDLAIIRADHTTLIGFGSRLDGHDTDIGKIQDTLEKLDPETLTKLAGLDADKLAALLDLDLDTALDDIAQLQADMTALTTKATILENGQQGQGDVPISGVVTVVIASDATPYPITSTTTAANQVIPVKITNGTTEYKTVTFNLLFHCISTDGVATIDPTTVDGAGTDELSMTVSTAPFSITPVSSYGSCQWIYFTWAYAAPVMVAPGGVFSMYATLNNFKTTGAGVYELWEVTLTGVSADDL